jgi:hypothetical protein
VRAGGDLAADQDFHKLGFTSELKFRLLGKMHAAEESLEAGTGV